MSKSDRTTTGTSVSYEEPPRGFWRRLKLLGPGLVVAATSIGAGDLIASSVAGSRFEYQLLWALVAGCILKIVLAEAVGRWHLLGETLFAGWRRLGRWTTWYFAIFVTVFGFVLGAANLAATAMPLHYLFPALPLQAWGIISGVFAFVFVVFNKYVIFERVMATLIGFMFITIVCLALVMAPNIGQLIKGAVPAIPDGGAPYALAIMGGVGGSITLAAYGYWVTAKGWDTPRWLKVMQTDSRIAYLTIGVTAVAMMVFGVELLHVSGSVNSENSEQWLTEITAQLSAKYGAVVGVWFVLGFLATSISTMLGVWHGVSLVFTDFIKETWAPKLASARPERSTPFRLYVTWLTFPPMIALFFGQPVALVVLSGVLGASFLPFLSGTLLILLNSKSVPKRMRNRTFSNTLLVLGLMLFAYLFAQELIGYFL